MDKSLFYAGIGSRETPNWAFKPIKEIVRILYHNGYSLRSGGAGGADQMFEQAFIDIVPQIDNNMEIFLPYSGFEKRWCDEINYFSDVEETNFQGYPLNDHLFECAKAYHPKWKKLNPGSKKMMARNAQQVLGRTLDNPSKLIVCYTEHGETKGGTGQALRMASELSIPVFNLGKYEYAIYLVRGDVNKTIAVQQMIVDNFKKFLLKNFEGINV